MCECITEAPTQWIHEEAILVCRMQLKQLSIKLRILSISVLASI